MLHELPRVEEGYVYFIAMAAVFQGGRRRSAVTRTQLRPLRYFRKVPFPEVAQASLTAGLIFGRAFTGGLEPTRRPSS
jgi:hypothetical protein